MLTSRIDPDLTCRLKNPIDWLALHKRILAPIVRLISDREDMEMVKQVSVQELFSSYFGPFAVPAWDQLAPVEATTKRQEYTFMDMETYNEIVRRNPEEAQAIYWHEIILRIHLASCSGLRRHGEWLRSLVTAVETDCLFGAYASYRGFLESAVDSLYSLGTIPKAIAEHLPTIINRLKQKPTDTVFLSPELENRLIHFSHGRKLERGESADPVHAAKQIREYLDAIKDVGAENVHELYSELCAMTHPSADSVVIWYCDEKAAHSVVWRRNNISNRATFFEFLDRWKETSELIVNAAFVPIFMNLRILHKFDFLPKIPDLKSFPFDAFPAWKHIDSRIKK